MNKYVHYWVRAGAIADGNTRVDHYRCESCFTEMFLYLAYEDGVFKRWFEYFYPNGDSAAVFDPALADPCSVEDWDLGVWLPGATKR